MNRDRLEGLWKQVGGFVGEQWGRLTNDPVRVSAGRHNQRVGRAQKIYGIFKEESRRELKQFMHRNRKWDLSNR
jgi:uncharacterized protein YjbJ (UPF0337 family)